MFLLNNTFIQGLHVLTGAKYLNTMSNGAVCTVGFSAIWAVLSWVCSLPRTFDTLSKLATLSAGFTFISVLLAAVFAGVEGKHGVAGYNTPGGGQSGLLTGEPHVLTVAMANTGFVSGTNAFLNISYTFIGQITIPSFIAEMKNPKDFPKALYAVTICEIFVFSIVASVIYAYTGTQYNTSPAFGSLGNVVYKKVAFSFMIPTLIFLGVLYASVSARFVFFRIFEGTRHKGNHTVVGWASWAGILAATWITAFIIAEVIPFFSDLLSLMSSLFDSFFGFIFWGTAYMRMRQADLGPGWIQRRGIRGISGFLLNVSIIVIGLFMLGGGTYATCQSIVDNYKAGTVGGFANMEATKLITKSIKRASNARLRTIPCIRHQRESSISSKPPLKPSSNINILHRNVFCTQKLQPQIVSRRWSSDDASRSDGGLNQTALHDMHIEHGGKMVSFGGYSMPVQYSDLSVGDSHKWTREKASLFDVGHMVQHRLSGPGAAPLLERMAPTSTAALGMYNSTLSCLLHPATGGIVDDTVITRLGPETFYLVTNAACKAKDVVYLEEQIKTRDRSHGALDWEVLEGWGLVALQGPLSVEVLERALMTMGVEEAGLDSLYFGQCKHVALKRLPTLPSSADTPILISRGGYTGEDGFEVSVPPSLTAAFARHLLGCGGPDRVRLAGLGARDSLRLEAGMCLYGHDIDDTTTPVEAGLSWVVHKDRRIDGGFNGDQIILSQLRSKKDGGAPTKQKRVGLLVEGAPAREGAQILNPIAEEGKTVVGKVTSGCPSPTLGKNIAMGYVKTPHNRLGTALEILVRGKPRRAEVVKMPFVQSRYWFGDAYLRYIPEISEQPVQPNLIDGLPCRNVHDPYDAFEARESAHTL
ncbi:Aminomethyltransferase, mitochondrial [Lecanora helva]